MSEFIEQPAVVELFGHTMVAGYISEEEHIGSSLLRVDVPGIDGVSAFTKFYGSKAIYGITPTDEETMLAAVRQMRVKPVALYILPSRQLPAGSDGPDWDEYDPEEDDDWTDPDSIP